MTLLGTCNWNPTAVADMRAVGVGTQGANAALSVPATVLGRCSDGALRCQVKVPSVIRHRTVRFPKLPLGGACPTSAGSAINVPGASGWGLKGRVVSLLIPQAGDPVHGTVQLAASDVAGWYGIKTHWIINPSYSGWVIVRAEQLDAPSPVAALGEAGIGPVIIPPGPTANTFRGWRQEPSGTYVKRTGCFGFQIDGAGFQEHLILKAVLPPNG